MTELAFDELAASFDAQRGLPKAAVAALVQLIEELADGNRLRVIEPGIGTGRIATAALAGEHHLVGVDLSRAMLRELHAKLSRVSGPPLHASLVQGDARALPFTDATFDLAILASVLYLIVDWRSALDELWRVVRPGGHLLLVTERSVERPALATWDALWREAIEGTGYRHAPMEPDDETLLGEMGLRAAIVSRRTLHTWTIGRTVGEARRSHPALRPLYATIGDESWNTATSGFLATTADEFPDPETRLDCDVHLDVAVCRSPGGDERGGTA
jgi:SAM-dependent methyltransferase